MNFKRAGFFVLILVVLILGISVISATEDINDTLTQETTTGNEISINDSSEIISQNENNIEDNLIESESQDSKYAESNEEIIIVNNWDELQYYCSLTDKDYILKLKENTNFYPTDLDKISYQIKINNNVKIIGSEGAYFGDICQHHGYIKNGHFVVDDGKAIAYTPIIVPDNNRIGLTLENITFKWIIAKHNPDAIFIQMGGNSKNVIKNCIFENITMYAGHSCIVYLKKGDALLENCSFINCTTDFGCVSLYDPNSYTSARMTVKDCYFENNFARTEPGCINNCAVLTVYNTTFYKNRAGMWAGAIHTHFYASATIYDSNFTDNLAGWNGGALYTYSDLKIYNTIFSGNNCTTNNGGGAIGACKHVSPPHIYIENSLFENNANNCWGLDELSTTGTGRGGAISLMDEGSLEVRNTTFISNAASIGTAICAIEAGSYGSPDVIIVNNTFIGHIHAGDVIYVRVNDTLCNISDNYYLGNSIEFSNLTLTKLNEGKEQSTLQITATLTNPSYYDADILDKTLYDVYVNDQYVKTVNSTIFTLDFGDLDICNVYVMPTISNRKSNEVTLVSTREYIFVSNQGNDSNNGSTRDAPIKTIQKAIELAKNCQNIIVLDGNYSEDIVIDYDLTLKGENDATLTGNMFFNADANFTLKNIKVKNLNSNQFIKQGTGSLIIVNCIFEDNQVSGLIQSNSIRITNSIIQNTNGLVINSSALTTISNSILLNNTNFINGNDYDFDYNWWGSTWENFQDKPFSNINNWLVLNATSNRNSLEVNQSAVISFGFYLFENGTVSKYDNLRDVELRITAVNGTSINATSSSSKIGYTLTSLGNGELTAEYNNIQTHVNFEFVKTDPNIKVQTENIMVRDDLTVKVTIPNDATGNITVSVGNSTQNKIIDSNVLVFTFTNLKADDYNVVASYSGDAKYLPKEIGTQTGVLKYNSTTVLEIGVVEVGEDVILTITTPSDATGNITLKINNDIQTLAINNSQTSYTIKNIKRGDYLISAVYNGDYKYMESSDSKFIEVDNLNATFNVRIDDIIYGQDAVIQVTLSDDATGNVTVSVDGMENTTSLQNGRATIRLGNLEAGLRQAVIFYTGDGTYFNKTASQNFTINKANLVFEIASEDIKIGQDAVVHIRVPAKTTGTFTIGSDVINIPMLGIIDYIISDLEIGEYDITATYNGNNYNTVSNSTAFSVLEYPEPQWANEGGNPQNTGQSSHEGNVNGEVGWFTLIDDEIIGNLVIDSEGNIYIATKSLIYSFDNQGNLRWTYSSESLAGNFSGLCIGRDVIISPSAGDTLYFINQTDGMKYGSSNLYQASSNFASIVDSNADLYVVSEYQYDSNSYKLVKIPYRSWEYGGEIISSDLGNVKPLAAPTVSDDLIVVLSQGRLRVIDAKTMQVKFIKAGNYANIKPIIGEGNIIYAVLSDSIVAYSSSGSQLWKTKVTGGIGDRLVMDGDLGLYATNADGNLYRFNVIDGKESLISNLEITSGILVGSNGNLYLASDKTFYEINSKGEILWKSVLSSKITGNPVMDENGRIYVTSSDNKIFALTYADLKDPNLAVTVNDYEIKISLDNETTGNVYFTLNGVRYENVFVKGISDLNAGKYTINVTYAGDMRFNSTSKIVDFTVKANATAQIESTKKDTISISLPDDATGNLTVIAGNATYTQKLTNGKASISITGLDSMGKVSIIYSGDNKYHGFNKTVDVTSTKVKLTGSNVSVLYSSNSYYKVRLTQNSKALVGKSIILTVNGKTVKVNTDKNGYVSLKITLPPKTYKVTAQYGNLKIQNKITVKSIISAKNINAKKSAKKLKVKVALKKVNGKFLKGKKVTLKFNKKNFKAKTNKKGIVTFTIKKNVYKKLKVGKRYTYQVIYGKDTVKKTIKFKK